MTHKLKSGDLIYKREYTIIRTGATRMKLNKETQTEKYVTQMWISGVSVNVDGFPIGSLVHLGLDFGGCIRDKHFFTTDPKKTVINFSPDPYIIFVEGETMSGTMEINSIAMEPKDWQAIIVVEIRLR